MEDSVAPIESISSQQVETDINSATWNDLHLERQIEDSPTTLGFRTGEWSPDLSLGGQLATTSSNMASGTTIEDSFIMIEASDENDPSNKEASKETIPNEIEVYEVISGHHDATNTSEVLHKYPHIFIKLCDGEIINADSGESITNLSQFMVANNLDMVDTIETDQQSQLGQQIVEGGGYCIPDPLTAISDQSSQLSQFDIDNRLPSQTLTQLNQSLIDHEETVIATSVPSSQVFDPVQISLALPPSSQTLIIYDEAENILEVNNLELQVTEDMRDLLSGFLEGWWEGETKMVYHTDEGVPNEEMENISRNRKNKTPTNANC